MAMMVWRRRSGTERRWTTRQVLKLAVSLWLVGDVRPLVLETPGRVRVEVWKKGHRAVDHHQAGVFLSTPTRAPAALVMTTRRPVNYYYSKVVGRRRIECWSQQTESVPQANGEEESPPTTTTPKKTAAERREEAEWETVVSALSTYKGEFGNLRVPTRFIVPEDEAWPEATQGLRLGNKVAAIRSAGKFVSRDESRRALLDSMGFEWRLRRLRRETIKLEDLEPYEIFKAALETHVAVNGRKQVPKLFVVPNLDPWPENLRGLPLGASVEAMKQYNLKLQGPVDHPYFQPSKVPTPVALDRLAALAGLGLKLKNVQAQIAQIALLESRAEGSDTTQDNTTHLDHDTLPAVASGGSSSANPAAVAASEPPTESDKKELSPAASSVESSTSTAARTTKAEGHPASSDAAFQVIVDALRAYREIVGEGRVAQTFVVPTEAPWPESTRGVTLGLRLSKIRLNGTYIRDRPDRRAILSDLGLEFSDDGCSKTWGDAVSTNEGRAVKKNTNKSPTTDGRLKGGLSENDDDEREDDDDERDLVDSTASPTPTSRLVSLTHDFFDGTTVPESEIRRCRAEGWDFDDFEGDFDLSDVARALAEYERRYGDFDVPLEFVVGDPEPTEEELAAEKARAERAHRAGIGAGGGDTDPDAQATDQAEDLDAALAALLSADKGASSEPSIDELLALEAETGRKDLFDDDLRRLLADVDDALGENGVHDDDDASNPGVSPDDDGGESLPVRRAPKIREPWPADLEGLKLGFVTDALRVGDVLCYEDPEKKAVLDAIGFDWGDREVYIRGVQWHHFLACLFSYSKIKGSLMVAWDFVVPDEDPWPLPLRGEPLGRKVNLIRDQQHVLRTHFQHRARLLDAMGFVFLPPVFAQPPLVFDARLPPCLRLDADELELTRQDRRRKSSARVKLVGDFVPPEPGTPDRPVEYSFYTVVQLKEICRHRGLPTSGKVKQNYIDRLADFDKTYQQAGGADAPADAAN